MRDISKFVIKEESSVTPTPEAEKPWDWWIVGVGWGGVGWGGGWGVGGGVGGGGGGGVGGGGGGGGGGG